MAWPSEILCKAGHLRDQQRQGWIPVLSIETVGVVEISFADESQMGGKR